MVKSGGKGIRQRAISELENLSLSLDEELEITANMTTAEIDDELRELGVEPDRLSSVSLGQMLSEKTEPKSPVYVYVSDDLLDNEITTDEVKFLIVELRDLSQQRRYEEALELARLATHLAPHYWRAWVSYGSLVALLGHLDEGEAIFRRVREDFSGNPKAVAAALHGCASAKEVRCRLNPSGEDLLEVSRLYEEALEFDNSRANTRACLVINSLLSLQTNKGRQLFDDSLKCEGFVDAMLLELRERGAREYAAKMYKVMQALPMRFRDLFYRTGPSHGEITGTSAA